MSERTETRTAAEPAAPPESTPPLRAWRVGPAVFLSALVLRVGITATHHLKRWVSLDR